VKKLLACAVLVFAACDTPFRPSLTKGGSSIVASDDSVYRPLNYTDRSLATLTGADWIGAEEAFENHGESGDIVVTIQVSSDTTISGRIKFVGKTETIVGSVSGDLQGLRLVADAGQSPTGTRCEYSANAAYTVESGTEILSGIYQGRGPDPCPNKAGRFRVTRKLICVGGATLNFSPNEQHPELGNRLAVYPSGSGPLPGQLPIRDFAIPAGTWDFAVGTIDPGHVDWMTEDPDNEQTEERVILPLYDAVSSALLHTLGPTDDVPWKSADLVVTTFRNVVLSSAVGSVKVIHAFLGQPVAKPLHSVEIRFVTYSCPTR